MGLDLYQKFVSSVPYDERFDDCFTLEMSKSFV